MAGKDQHSFPFGKRNGLLAAAAMCANVIGYLLLRIPPAEGFASLTLAPVFLVAGYCVLMPAALLVRDPGRTSPADTPKAKGAQR